MPHLTRCWSLRGTRQEIPTPGKNRKQPVFGAVNFRTGRLLYDLYPKLRQAGSLLFLHHLVRRARRTGKRITLVWDNARHHTTHAVEDFLEEHKKLIEVYWLPPYTSTDLNLIEPVWGHVKDTGFANVLFQSFRRFQKHVVETLSALNRRPQETLAIVYRLHEKKKVCKLSRKGNYRYLSRSA